MYHVLQSLARIVLPLLFRLTVTDAKRVPSEGAVLLCSNHGSNWDPILLGTFVDRKVAYMAKEELFRFWPLAMLVRAFDAFPVRRGSGDRQAMRIALSLLDHGRVLAMFPEGHRRPGAKHVRIERGVGMLAAKSDATIVPVLIRGSYRLFQPLDILFGEPFRLGDVRESAASLPLSGRDLVDRATEIIARRMQELMGAAQDARVDNAETAP